MSVLAHSVLAPPRATAEHWMLFLHGILGTRANWRGFARKWMARRPGWGAVLADLRMHGDSQGFAPPHTVDACADDLVALSRALGHGFSGVLGHSFGGKVALALAQREVAQRGLTELWSIDSMPGPRRAIAAPGSPLRIIDLLESMPLEHESRDVFVEAAHGLGIGRAVAQWLAMNLEPHGEHMRLRLDLGAVRALLLDFLARDDWATLLEPPAGLHVHAVVAGRSDVWTTADLERAQAHVVPGRFDLHRMPDVGHWVHVEAPDALLAIVAGPEPGA